MKSENQQKTGISVSRDLPVEIGTPKRVGIFLDIPNVETASYKADMPFEPGMIRERARTFGNVIMARAYGIVYLKRPISNGVMTASREGFEFVSLVQVDEGRKDIDTRMTSDLVEAACGEDIDVIVIASGDSDFIPALRIARKRGKKVIVMAVEGTYSRMLKEEADEVISIEKGEDLVRIVETPPDIALTIHA
jgi:uncharacterized protein (TIGR00288 family)